MKTFIFLTTLSIFVNSVTSLLRADLAELSSNKALDPFSKMSDAELEKMLKDMGMSNKEINALGTEEENKKSAVGHEKKKKPVDKKPLTYGEMIQNNRKYLRNFELTQRDAFNLIHALKKFHIFSRLPLIAMNLINDINKKSSYKSIEKLHLNRTEETNNLISNTLNSQIFIDHENRMGRKGLLTVINKDIGKPENLWAVLNNKVFAFYKTSNFLHIQHIYRISSVKIKDAFYSPCFFLYYDNLHEEEKKMEEIQRLEMEKSNNNKFIKKYDPKRRSKKSKIIDSMQDGKLKDENLQRLKKMKLPPIDGENKAKAIEYSNKKNTDEDLLPLNFSNSQLLVCALNFREKDLWLSTFKNNKEFYKE